jgi:hypothetical protein
MTGSAGAKEKRGINGRIPKRRSSVGWGVLIMHRLTAGHNFEHLECCIADGGVDIGLGVEASSLICTRNMVSALTPN